MVVACRMYVKATQNSRGGVGFGVLSRLRELLTEQTYLTTSGRF